VAQQPGTAGDSEGSEGEEEGEEYDSELATWLMSRLQRLQPGAELTVGSVKVLGRLLDEITVRVLDEAQRASGGSGDAAAAEAASSAVASLGGAAAAEDGQGQAAAGAAAPAAPAGAQQQDRRGKQAPLRSSALTSLDIHKVGAMLVESFACLCAALLCHSPACRHLCRLDDGPYSRLAHCGILLRSLRNTPPLTLTASPPARPHPAHHPHSAPPLRRP
jgi:hypothetical protein